MCGEGRKTQAGGGVAAGRRRHRPGRQPEAGRALWPPGRRAPASASPGRLKTAIGRVAAMRCQSRQRWKLARLSAPIIQTAVDAGQARQQAGQRLGRIGRAELGLDAGDPDARMAGDGLGGGDAAGEVVGGRIGFQRVLRRDQPPDLIEAEALQRHQADRAGGRHGRGRRSRRTGRCACPAGTAAGGRPAPADGAAALRSAQGLT